MRTHTYMGRLHLALLAVMLLASTGRSGLAQEVIVFAEGLTAPQGIEFDEQGRLWVAEQGSGSDDGRISVVTSDGQVHPYLTGLPSNMVQGQPESAHHLLIRNGVLWASLGLGETDPDGFLLHADISGFVPGAPPLSMSDVEADVVGTFVLDVDFANDTGQTNIYNMAFGPGEDLYIVDASANATQPAGEHTAVWDGKDDFGYDVASGAYLYRMQVDGTAETRMVLLIK